MWVIFELDWVGKGFPREVRGGGGFGRFGGKGFRREGIGVAYISGKRGWNHG